MPLNLVQFVETSFDDAFSYNIPNNKYDFIFIERKDIVVGGAKSVVKWLSLYTPKAQR